VLRHRFITLMTMFGTIALTGYLFVIIPKGFFPQQDTGLIIGLSEAAQDISFQAMAERQQALINAVMQDRPSPRPIGGRGRRRQHHCQQRPRIHCAQAPEPARRMDEVMTRLRTNLAKIQGITLYMQAAQDVTIGGRLSRLSINTP